MTSIDGLRQMQQSSKSNMTQKWTTALKQIPKSYVKPSPEIPSLYILIGEAGSGMHGDAYFCLPIDTVMTTKLSKSKEVLQDTHDLASEVQVIKVGGRGALKGLYEEVAILKALQ
jgi:hypothetical protein